MSDLESKKWMNQKDKGTLLYFEKLIVPNY